MSATVPPFVVVATGMRAEVRIAERSKCVHAVAGGGDGAALRRALARALADGAVGVMSFGIAGGLAPDLRPGDVIVADAVIAGSQRFEIHKHWRQHLEGLISGARAGAIAGSDAAVATVGAKAALLGETGALAVDMESHIAAQFAADHRLPFAALRVVADHATRALPPAALAGMAAGGAINIRAVLASLLRQPRQLPQLICVARDTNTAMAALLDCHRLAGPGLGFPLSLGARFGGRDLG